MKTVYNEKNNTFLKKGLLFILIFAFVISSVSGIVFLTGKYDIIKTNKNNLSINEYLKYLNQEKQLIYNEYVEQKKEINLDFLNSKFFMENVLDKILNYSLLRYEINDYYITSPKESIVKNKILNNNEFFVDDKFDNLKFRQYLNKIGISENDYLNALSEEESIKSLIRFFTSINYSSNVIIDKMSEYYNTEKKIILYSKNKNIFDLKNLKFSDEELKNYYNNNKFKFIIQESKKIDYINIKILNDDEINKINDQILLSKNFEELAKNLKQKIKTFGYKTLNDSLKNEKHNFSKILSMKIHEISKIEKINDDIYIYSISDIKNEKQKNFEESKQEIVNDLKESKIYEILFAEANKYIQQLISKKINEDLLKNKNFVIKSENINIKKDKLDDKFIEEVLLLDNNKFTKVFADNDKIYFAKVVGKKIIKSDSKDYTSPETLMLENLESFLIDVQENYLNFLKNKYKVKVNLDLLNLIK